MMKQQHTRSAGSGMSSTWHPKPCAAPPLAACLPVALAQTPCRGDNVAAPFNIADSTLAAEAYRLVAEHLSGGKPTYVLTSTAAWTGVADTKAIAVRDGNAFYVYIVNKSGLSTAIVAQVKLVSLGIGAGVPVFVDRVNAASTAKSASSWQQTQTAWCLW
jgi:hypothetical protein